MMTVMNLTTRQCAVRSVRAEQRTLGLANGSHRRIVVARNDTQNTEASTETPETPETSSSSGKEAPASPSRLQTPEKEDFVKGQGTAIVTGAISIIFGVAYLALVSLLDVRGGELQPPPPEAFLN